MPEQEPQVGQAERSISSTSASETLLSAALTIASTRSRWIVLPPILHHLAGFHRAAGDEDGRDVDAHRGHQHARRDLVAVGDAHHGVGAVGVDHVLDRIGDQVARGQRIEHAVVAHGDAVVDGDGVEFLGDAAGGFDFTRHQLPEVLEVHVAGNELGEGIDDGDDRFAEIAVLHSGGAPQGAGAGHVAAVGRGAGTICGHGRSPKQKPAEGGAWAEDIISILSERPAACPGRQTTHADSIRNSIRSPLESARSPCAGTG
jgi:hypothetical protein